MDSQAAGAYLVSHNGSMVQSGAPGEGAGAMLDAPVPGASTLARILQLEAAKALKSARNSDDTSNEQTHEDNTAAPHAEDQPSEIITAASLEALEEEARLNEEAIARKAQELKDMHTKIAEKESKRNSVSPRSVTSNVSGRFVAQPSISPRGSLGGSMDGSPRSGVHRLTTYRSASSMHTTNTQVPTHPQPAASVAQSVDGRSTAPAIGILSPKDIDAVLRGEAIPAGREFLQAGTGVAGGRRGSYAPVPLPEELQDSNDAATFNQGRRRSIAEKLYGHVQPKVESRRASAVAADQTNAEAAAAAAAAAEHLVRGGQGHGGGVRPAASMQGFKGDYGAKYGHGEIPGGSRIWMPGNIDLPAELGLMNELDDELEDQLASTTLANRQPSVEYLVYAERMRSLRLRDGGGLVELLGIDLDAATQQVAEQNSTPIHRKPLHLILTGPAFGLDFEPAPHVPGEAWADRELAPDASKPVRWSNTIISAVSKVSPFQAIIAPGDPLIAVDGESVSHLDYEHAWQRVIHIGAHATETTPHTITILVPPAALVRAKVIMRAELEHTRREEILARYSSVGMTGLDRQIPNMHDDRATAAQTLVKASRPKWNSGRVLTPPGGKGAFSGPDGLPDSKASPDPKKRQERQELKKVEDMMRARRSSYAEAAGYKGAATQVYGSPLSTSSSPVVKKQSSRDLTASRRRSVELNPAVFAPITVQLDDNTVASCRATRGGYTMDITFTAQPVGVLLKGLVVQSTLAGSAADGIVERGDTLVRVGIYDVRNWNGRGPSPAELVLESVQDVSPHNPLHLRFFREADVHTAALGGAIPAGMPQWAVEALNSTNTTSPLKTQTGGAAAIGSPGADGPNPSAQLVAAEVAQLRELLSRGMEPQWIPSPKVTTNGALITVRSAPAEVRMALQAQDASIKSANENAAQYIASRDGRHLDAVLPPDTDYRFMPSHTEDVVIDVTFTAKPFGILLASGHLVAGLVNGSQAADALQPDDEIIAAGGHYVWSAEVQAQGGIAPLLAAAATDVSLHKPFTISFLRRSVPRMPMLTPEAPPSPGKMSRTNSARFAQSVAAQSPVAYSAPAAAPHAAAIPGEFKVSFTSFPYFIRFAAAPYSDGKPAGALVDKVMEGTISAQYVRPNDRLVKCGDFDVSNWELGQIEELLADDDNLPTESRPSVLTFRRAVE